ncbi:MAG TPA: adenylate/guanylate cyclase domain-containing protein [Nitrososphaerales archaeon]|nr:adenylate/guanylate cyclase domain-containing protein [Nitrososphaerales archaeon]
MPEGERRLGAIMFTDIVGYTSLTQANEQLAMQLLEEHRKTVRPILERNGGREVKTIGDAFLVEFPNALDAVRCSFELQQVLHESNSAKPQDRQVHIRVGIHLGDVIHENGDVYGDAVNLASRIEPLAPPGGICITEQVQGQVKYKLPYPMVELGPKQVKNIKDPVNVYRVVLPWEESETMSSKLDSTRVAVLPFANFSPDPNDEYFADGITEEIISTVAGVSGLSVISRTSVMSYKGSPKKVKEIGKELEVGSVLEGSFRKAGNRIRITTQLIDVAADKHLWAQNYDRQLDDVFEVQSDIAKQVAEALRVKILPADEKRIDRVLTKNSDAHSSYLKGRYLWNQRNEKALRDAIQEYELAIKQDQGFSLAYSGIADCYNVLGNHGYIPYTEAQRNAEDFARKAVELDGTSAEAHTSLAGAIAHSSVEDREAEFKKAIELNPSYATAYHWYGILLLSTGRKEAALAEAKRAQQIDPLSPQIAVFLGLVYHALGDYGIAEKQLLRALQLQPDFLPAIGNLISHYYVTKRFREAETQLELYRKISKDDYACDMAKALGLAMQGRSGEARALLVDLESRPVTGQDVESLRIASYLALGETEMAMTILLEERRKDADWLPELGYDPLYERIRSDPRVQSILKELHAVPS